MADTEKERAQRYSAIRYSLSIAETGYLVVLILIFLGSGLSKNLALKLFGLSGNYLLATPLYILAVSIAYYLLNFPLNFYRSYLLERRFSLSTQKIKDWVRDELKQGAISYVIALILISVYFYSLRHFIHSWWFICSLLWIIFSLALIRLTPVLLIPLFFKYRELSDANLKGRIIGLAKKMQVEILDCLEIDFSKKTLKGNAGLVGWGKTRRVILADTLKDRYSNDEIEVILAHEFAHHKDKHLLKLLLLNSLFIILTFFIIYQTSDPLLRVFSLRSLWDISSLPLLLLYFLVLGLITQPLENYISRRFEEEADLKALKATGLKHAFISMMEKLSRQNLADTSPHPLIKHLFFDHPPADERIAMARDFK
jgi:STE24 endopeptidase